MGWPKFDDEQSLNADPWGHYFESVYGGLPSKYPICIFDFWFLYKDKLQDAGITIDGTDCSDNEGAYIGAGSKPPIGYQTSAASWIRHPTWSGLQSNTWVEVTHAAASEGAESEGAWFFNAPGSGLWVNVGNTKSLPEHDDVFTEWSDCQQSGGSNELCPCAKAHGFNSLQFTAHIDAQWKCKGSTWVDNGGTPLDFEIVMCDLDGSKACGGKSDAYRAGWMASKACDCKEDGGAANCQSTNVSPR